MYNVTAAYILMVYLFLIVVVCYSEVFIGNWQLLPQPHQNKLLNHKKPLRNKQNGYNIASV